MYVLHPTGLTMRLNKQKNSKKDSNDNRPTPESDPLENKRIENHDAVELDRRTLSAHVYNWCVIDLMILVNLAKVFSYKAPVLHTTALDAGTMSAFYHEHTAFCSNTPFFDQV